MSREKWDEIEAFRKRFWADVQANAVRERADYVREFPGLESEIDAELSNLARSLELGRRQAASGDIPPTVAAPSVGQADAVDREGRIGRYVLEKELGRGGQGRVYLARDPEIGLEVALKVLSLGQAMSTQAKLRFKGEAEKAAKLNHPNIARVHEWGEDQGVPFIAMEFVRGDTLAAHIHESARTAETGDEVSELRLSFGEASTGGGSATTEGKKKPAAEPNPSSTTAVDRRAILEIAELIESAARGLHEAHERSLVHRDIKPANLIVTRDRGLVILDFGLAHDDASDGPSLTMTGDVMGTPAYMSPEQLAAKRITVDRRSDVYSLGVTLFECLALRRPFEAPTREALFQEIVAREAPDLRKLNRKVPTDLAVIVHHALEKHPDQRYQSALEMAEDLRRFRKHEPIVARPVGPITRTWRWAQRKPATAGLLATVFVALAAIAIITSLNSRRTNKLNETLSTTNTKLATTNEQLEAATKEAEAKTEEALRNERRAQEEATAKETALAEKTSALFEYERMADVRRLTRALAEAENLWPESPELIPALVSWQAKYSSLFARLDDHRRALSAMRSEPRDYTPAEQRRDHPEELARLRELESQRKKLLDRIGNEKDPSVREANIDRLTKLEIERITLLETVMSPPSSLESVEENEFLFRRETLATLIEDLERCIEPRHGVVASISRRLDRSRRIYDETIGDRVALWKETTARIASNPRYGGLKMGPQLGLIPLGPDPASGLEEFLDWRTHDWSENDGALPKRGEAGRIGMTEPRGLIFVLISGKLHAIGEQKNRKESIFDPYSDPSVWPETSAFLISKYEMTQGQWSRSDGKNPSHVDPVFPVAGATKAAVDLRYPVVQVSWDDCTKRLHRLGLMLPTEEQWERVARATEGRPEAAHLYMELNCPDDEQGLFPRPVGSFSANSLGLHAISNNVYEWCREPFHDLDKGTKKRSGLEFTGSPNCVFRGDSFNTPGNDFRFVVSSGFRHKFLGVRPAMGIDTE